METVNQVLILFLMAGAGYLMVRLRIWNEKSISALTALVVNIAMPCLSFSKLESLTPEALGGTWVQAFFFSTVLLCALVGLGFLCFRKVGARDEHAVYVQLAAFSNCGFMGYPIIEAVLGEHAVAYGVAFVSAFMMITWSLGLALFCKDWKTGLKKMINPTLISVFLGIFAQLIGLRLPEVLSSTVKTLGDLTTPISMLISGAYFVQITADLFKNGRLMLACGLRLVVFPLLTLGIMQLMGYQGDLQGALYVVSIMPAASVTVMQAATYGGENARKLAVGGVAVTTALSAATIPLMMLILG